MKNVTVKRVVDFCNRRRPYTCTTTRNNRCIFYKPDGSYRHKCLLNYPTDWDLKLMKKVIKGSAKTVNSNT